MIKWDGGVVARAHFPLDVLFECEEDLRAMKKAEPHSGGDFEEDPEPHLDTPFRSFFDLTEEELSALRKQREEAIASGAVPAIAPSVFQILMKDEVIRNTPESTFPQKKSLLDRLLYLFRRG